LGATGPGFPGEIEVAVAFDRRYEHRAGLLQTLTANATGSFRSIVNALVA
jgi:hypothetical protein